LLTNVRDIYGTPMSEYAMSLILYEVRELGRFVENKKRKAGKTKYFSERSIQIMVIPNNTRNQNLWKWIKSTFYIPLQM